MNTKSCAICNTELEVEAKCKACDRPTRLFCHACGTVREKQSHPDCMIRDLASLMIEAQIN